MYKVIYNKRIIFSNAMLTPCFKFIEDRGLKDFEIIWED